MALILAMLMLLSTLSGCGRKNDADLSLLTPSSSVEETTDAEEGEEKPGEEKADLEVTAEPSETNEEEGAERSRSDAAQPEQPVEAPEEEPENGAAPEDESAQPTEDGSAQNDDPGAAPEE